MIFPFVTRHAYDTLADFHVQERVRYDLLLRDYMALRAQGHQPISPKIAPAPSDPETRYATDVEQAVNDPFLAEMVSQGYSLADARDIRRDAVERFTNGDA